MWKKLAVHNWVPKCKITETINLETEQRRFTATIDGWQIWRIMVVDRTSPEVARQVRDKVASILERIESGDEEVFKQSEQAW